MLTLHRLEISGFKSFVDPVATDFAPGITAIVGPNGCGKSNLAEAVTWALGEQSIKFLRGQRMEDVIFNGSQGRRALGMAEVNLTLLADPSVEVAVEGKVAIGRRVFRTGESQYRLNGKVVTLKRIRDLLMDTGLGIRSYSVISQGQVDTILSGNPQERRKLLEEAAGITRYKARKRVAEIKLEEAGSNLQRLDDILSEAERTLRSLKRQANAARRYREKESEHDVLLGVLNLRRWDEVQEGLGDVRKRLGVLEAEDAELSARLHGDEAALASGREEAEKLAQGLSEQHARQSDLRALIEGRNEYLKGSRQALEDAGDRLSRGAHLAEKLGEEIRGYQASLDACRSSHGELESELGAAESAVAQDQQAIELAQADLREASASVETLRAEVMASSAQTNALQARLHQVQIETEKADFRHEHNSSEAAKLADRLAVATKLREETQSRAIELEAAARTKSGELADTNEELEQTLSEEADASGELARLREEVSAFNQRLELIEQLEAAAEERRHRVEDTLEAAGLEKPRFLGDELAVPAGWEHSIDLYLEAFRDAVIVPQDEDPLALARILASKGSSGALLQATLETVDRPQIDDPAVLDSLATALGLEEPYAASLPPAFLVAAAADAERLARLHAGVAFLSRDRLWAQGGLLRVQGKEARPGALARKREMQEITTSLPAREAELEGTAELLETLVGRRTLQAETSNRLAREIVAVRQELAVAETRAQEAAQRLAELEQSRAGLEQQERDIVAELQTIGQRRDQLREQVDERQGAHLELEKSFDHAQSELDAGRDHREQVSTAGAGRQGRLDLLQERMESHRQETGRLQHRIDELTRQRKELADEEDQLARRQLDLGQGIEAAERELQEALEQRSTVQQRAKGEEEELTEKRQRLGELNEGVEKVRSQREGHRALIQDARVSEATLEQDAEHVAETYAEKVGCPIADAPAEARAPEADSLGGLQIEALSIEEIEAQIEERKELLERLGPVNLLAAKEYDEQEERFTFLTEQRADVTSSVESLRRTIREINQTSSERFRETFAIVNKSFNEVFSDLFRGGEAEMRLLDEEDVLESGIEIVARPPGKKMQNITLLSGGEKALTAIALLFALFKTKPSPFCILDEADAPLDDANVLRFVDLLRRYSADIQFLVISHNKLTMEAASTLYGVTMEEKGVSKLVAVELDEIHPKETRAATA